MKDEGWRWAREGGNRVARNKGVPNREIGNERRGAVAARLWLRVVFTLGFRDSTLDFVFAGRATGLDRPRKPEVKSRKSEVIRCLPRGGIGA